MMLERLRQDLNQAVKEGENKRIQTLRLLLSNLEYQQINKRRELTAEEETAAVKQEIKKRQEAQEAYTKVGHPERAEEEKAEEEILMEYLPAQASDEEIETVIKAIRAEMPEMGRGQMIGEAIRRIGKEKVDGGRVSAVIGRIM